MINIEGKLQNKKINHMILLYLLAAPQTQHNIWYRLSSVQYNCLILVASMSLKSCQIWFTDINLIDSIEKSSFDYHYHPTCTT